MFWAFRLDFVIWYPMYIFYSLCYLLFILFTNTRLATCAGQLVDFPVLIKKLLLSFISSSPYTFNYDDLYSKCAQWRLGFASFWTKKMIYKTDQTLFRWLLLPLYHNIVILGTSLVLGAVHFRHYRRLWMGQWMKKFGLGKKDLYYFPPTSSGVIVSCLLILAVCLMFVMR